MSDPGEFIALMCAAALIGFGCGLSTVGYAMRKHDKRQDRPPKPRPEPPKWQVKVETRNGYRYWNETDKDWTGPKVDVVAVCCVKPRSKDDDSFYSSAKVDIGHHDVSAEDLMEVIPKMVEKAEARCAELEALEASPR